MPLSIFSFLSARCTVQLTDVHTARYNFWQI